MNKLLLAALTLLSFSYISNAQCDANFTYTHVDCDSIWFVPASTGPQYTYYWNFGDGQSSTDSHPTYVYSADGSYAVILVLSDTVAGCTDVLTVPVDVNCGASCTLPIAWAYTVDAGNCNTQFVSTVMSGTAPFTYFWDFGDGSTSTQATPNHQYGNNAWYWACLTVTDANGCDTTVCDSVSVQCAPTSCDAQFTYSYASCDSIWFVPVSQGSQYVYNWDFGDGTFSNSMYPSHQYSADGTYAVVLQLIDSVSGCNDLFTFPVTIDCGTSCTVDGAFAYSVDSITCDVQFISTAFGGTAPYTYFWDFGDGNSSTDSHPLHQFQTQNWFSYTCLTITDANGCDTVICDSIVPNCTPTSCDAIFTAVNITCDSLWFVPASYGPQYSYYWDFGDGNTSTNSSPAHTFTNDGLYITTLNLIDSLAMCSDTYYFTVQINCGSTCTVDGDFSYAVDSVSCDVQFISSAWGGQAPYSYYWTFGDGSTSTQANPIHTYPTGGAWTPCLTITDVNGCDTSFCLPVYVNCTPTACDADFTFTHVSCDSVWFTPTGNYSGTALYTWYFGDGQFSNNYSDAHQYAADGTYYVILEVWDSLTGCYDSTLATVVVDCGTNCSVNGAFTWYPDSITCDVQFISTAFGGTAPYTFYWDFGDGNTSTDSHPIHSYPNNTVFTPCLTITDANGCDTTICDVVYTNCIGSSCDAQFTYTYAACDSIWFIPVSQGQQYDYWWDFGDGSTSTDPMPAHYYSANGTYTVVLYLTDSLAGCYQAFTMLVDVNCGFNPCGVNGAFASVSDSLGCTTYFTSTAFGGTAPYSYYWVFGDGTTSNLAHPSHSYPQGIWTPCLTITDANGCDTTICDVIYSNCSPPACDAWFNWTYVGCDSIWFIPLASGNGVTYYWDFGDGNTSNAYQPVHAYGADGTYAVVLTIIDSVSMCSNTYTALISINCNTTCSIGGVITYVPDSAQCGVYFASSVYGGADPYSYFWDFGDGNYSAEPHPHHIYDSPGTYLTKMTATDANGCDTTVSMAVVLNCTVGMEEQVTTYVHIYPNPSADIFNIELMDNADLEVYSISGQLLLRIENVYGNQTYPMDLSDFESGAYILKIHMNKEMILKRLIKQ
jgi:PKD repeat protein